MPGGQNQAATDNRVETANQLVNVLRRSVRSCFDIGPDRIIAAVIPLLSDYAATESRAAAYRVLRHGLVSTGLPLAEAWRSHSLDIYLTATLLRDRKSTAEKEQAVKLFRSITELVYCDESGVQPIGQGVVRAMVACAEHASDPMRTVYIETLVELAIFDLPLLYSGGALSVLLESLHHGPLEIAPEITKVLLLLLDLPESRAAFRPGIDLDWALSGFTDLSALVSATTASHEILQNSVRVVTTMLRSWAGLLYLCLNQRRAIVSLVTALKVGHLEVRTEIIKMLVDTFDVSLGMERQRQRAEAKEKSDLPELETAEGRAVPSRAAQEMSREQRERNRNRITLIDHYLSFVLVVFIDSGLIEALVHLLQTSAETQKGASLLMSTVLQLGDRVLPQRYNVMVHQLPDLFASALQLKNLENRGKATQALSAVDRASRLLRSQVLIENPRERRSSGASKQDQRTTGEKGLRAPTVTHAVGATAAATDETTFRSQLVDTQVLNTRDHTKWNIDLLMEIVSGRTLLNARRLEDAMRSTKFLRRLLAFFHPFALRFSDLPATVPNRVFTRMGCALLTTLTATSEGVKFLAEDGLLQEMHDAFAQISATKPQTNDPIFAKSRITSTLAQGYLEFVGTLSATNEGVKLLTRSNIWTAIYKLWQQQRRDDIVRILLEKLDYALDGHPRVLLSWAMYSGSRPLRRFATELLARIIRRNAAPNMWALELFMSQLGDTSDSIREIVIAVVKDVCKSPEMLERVIAMRPTLDWLGETGHELMLRFLSIPVGIHYLLEGDFIEREMEEWYHERSLRYAVQMEVHLTRATDIHRNRDDRDLEADFDGTAPPHFYGELVKTAEGCQLLDQKGHFIDFSLFIRQHGMESSDKDILARLKSVLWAVGNIGSSVDGLPFLESDGTVANIVDMAEQSPVLSVRGTCFYVIGLISSTRQGAEMLQDYGWQSVCTTFGDPIGICVPRDLDRFAHLPSWHPHIEGDCRRSPDRGTVSPLQRTVLSLLSDLSNPILTNKTAKRLSRLRQRHKNLFSDPAFFIKVLDFLDSFKLRQGIRKFVWDLMNVKLDGAMAAKIAALQAGPLAPADTRPSASDPLPRSVTLPALAHTDGIPTSGAINRKHRTMTATTASRSLHHRNNSDGPSILSGTALVNEDDDDQGDDAVGALLSDEDDDDLDESDATPLPDDDAVDPSAPYFNRKERHPVWQQASSAFDGSPDDGEDDEDEDGDDSFEGGHAEAASDLPRLAPTPAVRIIGGFAPTESTVGAL
ncbi:unnamed protein product [Jaminaea pallidilutea]